MHPPANPQKSLKVTAFFDGQNLFHATKHAFGYRFANYDPLKPSRSVCHRQGWELQEVRFYTGVPDAPDDAFWNHFWTAKLARMGRQGTCIYSRSLKYRNQTIHLDGAECSILVGQEKGIDIRIALDVIRLAHRKAFEG